MIMQGIERSTASDWQNLYPELPSLSDVLLLRQGANFWSEEPVNPQVDPHISGHYFHLADQLAAPAGTNAGLPLSERERQLLIEIFTIHHNVTPEQVAEADRFVAKELPAFHAQVRRGRAMGLSGVLPIFLALLAVLQLPFLLLFRATLGQWLFGFAVINKHGDRAGRLRLLGRWMLAFAPLMFFLAWLISQLALPGYGGWKAFDWRMLFFAALWLFGMAIAIARPARGLHDEWTRCWLVPR